MVRRARLPPPVPSSSRLRFRSLFAASCSCCGSARGMCWRGA
jgi:hypothetical protein